MTLSRKTLLSTPIAPTVNFASATARRLEAALLESEEQNLVGKMNAGKLNENVKHPSQLILRLNRFLAPNYAEDLLTLHANSSLVPAS